MGKEEKINIYWLNTLYPILLYTTASYLQISIAGEERLVSQK